MLNVFLHSKDKGKSDRFVINDGLFLILYYASLLSVIEHSTLQIVSIVASMITR